MRIRKVATVLGLAAAAGSFAAAAQECIPFDAMTAPGAPLEDAQALQPGPGYVWSPGYWAPRCDGQYDWVGGEWILPGYSEPQLRVHGGDRVRFEREVRDAR
ncbi:MAG: YXWGXW repeat-containing protein [Burkholderiales bacterium]|nr:YXWGXW repeat-containing protein [Burkholderiales bacterium]